MTIKTLEEKIDRRVQDQVDTAVRECRTAIYDAICRLEMDSMPSRNPGLSELNRKQKTLQSVLTGQGYPASLWAVRKEKLMGEVLGTMDALQRVLLAKDVPPEAIPEE